MLSPLFGYGTATLAHFPGQFPRANPVRVSQKQRRGRKPRARSRQRRPMAATGARVRGGGEGPRTPAPGTDAPRDQAKDAGREPRGRDTVRGDGGKETGGKRPGEATREATRGSFRAMASPPSPGSALSFPRTVMKQFPLQSASQSGAIS